MLCDQVKKEINCSSCQTRCSGWQSPRPCSLPHAIRQCFFQLHRNNWHNLTIPKCKFPLLYHHFYSGRVLRVQKPGCRWAVEREESGKGYCSWEWKGLCPDKGPIVLRRHVTLQRPWGLHNGPLLQCSMPTTRCSDSLPQICLNSHWSHRLSSTCSSPAEAVLLSNAHCLI